MERVGGRAGVRQGLAANRSALLCMAWQAKLQGGSPRTPPTPTPFPTHHPSRRRGRSHASARIHAHRSATCSGVSRACMRTATGTISTRIFTSVAAILSATPGSPPAALGAPSLAKAASAPHSRAQAPQRARHHCDATSKARSCCSGVVHVYVRVEWDARPRGCLYAQIVVGRRGCCLERTVRSRGAVGGHQTVAMSHRLTRMLGERGTPLSFSCAVGA